MILNVWIFSPQLDLHIQCIKGNAFSLKEVVPMLEFFLGHLHSPFILSHFVQFYPFVCCYCSFVFWFFFFQMKLDAKAIYRTRRIQTFIPNASTCAEEQAAPVGLAMTLPVQPWLTWALLFSFPRLSSTPRIKIISCYWCEDKEQMHTVKYSLLNCVLDWLITFPALIEDQGCDCRF